MVQQHERHSSNTDEEPAVAEATRKDLGHNAVDKAITDNVDDFLDELDAEFSEIDELELVDNFVQKNGQ